MNKDSRILIACEESQIVTNEFRKLGFYNTFSCDILPTSGKHPEWHIQGDVLEQLNKGWDLMIAHPPCTYLANCGLHYLKTKPARKHLHKLAVAFVKTLYAAPINKIALENPIGWLNTNWEKPSQIIQPYYFGDPELKTTCLWLKGLPLLSYEKTIIDRPQPIKFIIRKSGKKKGQRYNYYFRQGKTAKERSKTFPGIAKQMALQWS